MELVRLVVQFAGRFAKQEKRYRFVSIFYPIICAIQVEVLISGGLILTQNMGGLQSRVYKVMASVFSC